MVKHIVVLIGIHALLTGDLFSQGLFESSLGKSDSLALENVTINGFARSVVYGGKNNDDELYLQSIYSQMGLSADAKAGEYGDAYAEMRIRTGNEFNAPFTELELREAYVNLYLGPLQLKAGKQIMAWGATSFINPSDQSSPQDPAFRSPIEDDLRLGTWALQTKLILSNSTSLQVVWMPAYVPSELLTDVFEFPEYLEFHDHDPVPLTLENSGYRFNYDVRTGYFDMSLSFFHGYRNTPSIHTDTAVFDSLTMQPEMILLKKKPYKINSAGLNLTVPLGNYLIRAEAGWLQPVEDLNVSHTFPEISYTAEIEQSGSNITVIAGYYGKYILDFEKNEVDVSGITDEFPDPSGIFPPGTAPDLTIVNEYITEQTDGFNRLYNYQAKEFYHAVYASMSIHLFHELLTIDIPGMYNFSASELTMMPSLKFNITDGLSARFGGYYLYGKDNSLYALAGPELNALYMMLDLRF
ncbi:MAG: hypothetical protein K9J30_03920 [Bacteroidales bacterium]|nr:hypothetical protein [Bacteroidales bacterium]